jgi:hypothetical protein
MDKWINKMWCALRVGYFSNLERTGILTQAKTWINLEDIQGVIYKEAIYFYFFLRK